MRGLAAVLAAIAGPATAQGIDCSRAVTQADLNACAFDAWQAADRELNQPYVAAIEQARDYDAEARQGPAGLEDDAEATLREAQRAWVVYRDPACEAQARPLAGGSAQPMEQYGCLQHLTEQRTELLWQYARFAE